MPFQFLNHKLNPLRNAPNCWEAIEREEALSSAPEYARLFFATLRSELPAVDERLEFLQYLEPGLTLPEDIYAVCQSGTRGMTIMIDCDLDLIVIWSDVNLQGEHGDWGEGVDYQVQQAIEHVHELIRRSKLSKNREGDWWRA